MPRTLNEHGDVVYDVFRGSQRCAWGLTDAATARRWLRRLSGSSRDPTPTPPDVPDSDDGGGASVEDVAEDSSIPRRVWWNEA